MANIPVERKSGAGWLPWLIGLLVVGGLIWLVAELFDNEPDADELAGTDDNVGVIDDVELGDDADAGLLTDPNELYDYDYAADPLYGPGATGGAAGATGGATDDATGGATGTSGAMASDSLAAGRMEGREVDFDQTTVLNVVGDSAFYIGTDDARRVLVVLAGLGENETGAGGSDGRFNIDAGDTVSVSGTVTRFQEGAPGTYALPDADRQRLLERPLYVQVERASDVSAAEGTTIETEN